MVLRVNRTSAHARLARSDLAMIALGLVANGFLAIAARPLLATEFLPPGASTLGAEQARVLLVMVPLLIVAALAARRSTARAQLFARLVAWSSLAVGTVVATSFPRLLDRGIGAAIAAGSVAALLAMGASGLTFVRRERTVQLTRAWCLALEMTGCDLLLLSLSTLLALRVGSGVEAPPLTTAPALALATGIMAVALTGLLFRRHWALALNLLANVAIATLALNGRLGVSSAVASALVATAVVHGLVLLPLWVAPLTRRDRPRRRWTGLLSNGPEHQPLIPIPAPTPALSSLLSTGTAALAVLAAPGPDGRGGWLQSRAFLRGEGEAFVADHQDLRGIDLAGVDLHRASFVHADLRGADLHGARGRAKFLGARLDAADLRQVTMARSSLRGASLTGADLRDAGLRHADFLDADLHDADLRGADLRDTNLEGTDLHRSDLRGADLRGAHLPWSDRALGGPQRWFGARCPDGVQSDPQTGCRHHRLRRSRVCGPDCDVGR